MPLRLVPPREGKSPHWTVRGTYLGRYVNRSTKTGKRAAAEKVRQKWEREIESGEFAIRGEATFADAALAYMSAGGERAYLKPLLEHFTRRPLSSIDQTAIDGAATTLYPNASPATRNRQVYTPVSAVLKHAGVDAKIRRPKGSAGASKTDWLWAEEAFRLFEEAENLDKEFAALLILLCYTGMRLSEALEMKARDVRLAEGYAYVPTSKNDEPRGVFLPPFVVAALANHPRGMDRGEERVFRFHKGGHIYSLLKVAAAKAGVTLPERQAFHLFRHTWATWMRRDGKLDVRGLVGTGAWKDQKSAARYAHVVVSEEARRAELLPTPDTKTG